MIQKVRCSNTTKAYRAKDRLAQKEPDLARVVDFRMGEIEAIPVNDSIVDCVVSNCVINLVPDKVVS